MGGELLGVGASGRAVELSSSAILRSRDVSIAEAWDEVDLAGWMDRLGA
jgi:hypothetical protein